MVCAAPKNLQRNSEVYFSTVDLLNGGDPANMTARNTWRVEVLAGYAASQSAATQDITATESGDSPDRGTQRFNTAINPAEWSFSSYIRPTGLNADDGSDSATGNVKPLADWFIWQMLMSNTNPAAGNSEQSTWQPVDAQTAKFELIDRPAVGNVFAHKSNFSTLTENHMYIKMDNVIYQITKSSVNEVTVDAAIDGIATANWSGFGTNFVELTGAVRNNAVSVFGGIDNAGTLVTGNAQSNVGTTVGQSYHPWASADVGGVVKTSEFIKNKLSLVDINHKKSETDPNQHYVLPVTGLSFSYTNNATFLTPEELAALNAPIGQFTGSKTISGNFTAFLRGGANSTAQLFRNISTDTRTVSSTTTNANVQIGGTTAPFFSIFMPAAALSFPVHQIEDVIGLSVDFLAQESVEHRGCGDEITIFVGSTN